MERSCIRSKGTEPSGLYFRTVRTDNFTVGSNNEVVRECRASSEHLWSTFPSRQGLAILHSTGGVLSLTLSDLKKLTIFSQNCAFTFAKLVIEKDKLTVLSGDENGLVRVHAIDNNSFFVSPITQFKSVASSPIRKVFHTESFNLWVVQDKNLSLWQNGQCIASVSLNIHSNSTYISSQVRNILHSFNFVLFDLVII